MNVKQALTSLFACTVLVFHYQAKVHFFSEGPMSYTEQPMKISLYGTHGEKEDISLVLCVSHENQSAHIQSKQITNNSVVSHCRPQLKGNTTVSFLITTEVDVGDLMIVKLRWEKDRLISWSDWWGSSKFLVRKLRIKSGETQSKQVNFHHSDLFNATRIHCK